MSNKFIIIDTETTELNGTIDFIIHMLKEPRMANPSSYTDEDVDNIEKYLQRHPNAITWTTMEGLTIPIKLIKDDHIKNIKKHMDAHFSHYGERPIYKTIMKEWKKRFASTNAGKVLFGN